MKKAMLVCAVALAVCGANAATMKTVRGLKAGDIGAVAAGRVSTVEVISEQAAGTVALKRVVDVDVYTNAYSTSVSTDTVVSVASVVTNRFFDHIMDGAVVGVYAEDKANWRFNAVSGIETNRYFDFYVNGRLERIFEEGGTNAYQNGVMYKDPMYLKSGDWRIMYGFGNDGNLRHWWYLVDSTGATNAQVLAEIGIGYAKAKEIDFGTFGRAVERIEYVPTSSAAGGKVQYGNDADLRKWWYLIDSTGATNAATRAETGVGWFAKNVNFGVGGVLNERLEYINSYATNTVITVSTNSVTPVVKKHISVTNQICSGTCSSGVYTNGNVDAWIFTGDKVIFEGTATGGLLRLVVE